MQRWLIGLLLAPALWGQHVIVIGIDGLGAEALRAAKAPQLRRLMHVGAWTLEARGVLPTVSSPNWASMIMGAGPEQHGVLSNQWEPGHSVIAPQCRGLAPTFPTIFGLLRQQQPSWTSALVYDWRGFPRLIEPNTLTISRHVSGSAAATDYAIKIWKEHRPRLLFLHLDDVDHAGHDHGWGSDQYRAAVESIDAMVGKLAAEVDLQAATLLISADHGGAGKEHGHNTQRELEIPWIAAGRGIRRNFAIREPVNTTDTAATIARLLGLKPPSCWIGRPVESALE